MASSNDQPKRVLDMEETCFFERKRPMKLIGRSMVPLILGGGYDIPAGGVRLSWCAGISQFFWTPIWPKMTVGIREILRCADRSSITLITGSPFPSPRLGSLLLPRYLAVLGLSYFDVWLQLWTKDVAAVRQMANWAAAQKAKGRIKLFGISSHRREVLQEALCLKDIDIIMLRYSAAQRSAEKILNSHAEELSNKIVISFTSTKWGYLISRQPGWPIENPIPSAADCYAYALSNPNIDSVLIGPSDEKELLAAFDFFDYTPAIWSERRSMLERYGDFIYSEFGISNTYRERRKFGVLPR